MPKILWVIIFGLPAFLGFRSYGSDERRQQAHGPAASVKSLELRKSPLKGNMTAGAMLTDLILDLSRPVLEHQPGRPELKPLFRDPVSQLFAGPDLPGIMCGRYATRLKAQACGILGRPFEYCHGLIYPHHWFW